MRSHFIFITINRSFKSINCFASFILKVALSTLLLLLGLVVSTQFAFHINESSTLQLLKCITNDLQKILKYFNGATIFTPWVFPFASVLPIRLDLYLNDEELAVVIPALLLLPVFFL